MDPTVTAGDGPADPPPAGPTGDRYRLGEVIARGGMGEVHAAHDAHLGRDVAVKVLLARLAGTAADRRFRHEARVTGQLQHPGVPPVYDLGTLPDGRPFLAMKLIKGRTLANHRPDGGRLPAVFEAVAQAVGYAHAHGVIHRDLKPQNVMVGPFGEVQVMDWGLAKSLANRERERPDGDPEATTALTEIGGDRDGLQTQSGDVLGTPAYMPPEQAGGETDKVDCRSDVFGLGAVLCHLLTGRPPYVGADAHSTRLMAVRGELADAFARLDGCRADAGLVALCKRCLAVNRADRPADAGAVAAEVAALREAAEDRARTAEREAAAGRVRRRLGAVAVGLLLLGVAGTTAGMVRADRQCKAAEAERDAAARARTRAREVLDAMTGDHAQLALLSTPAPTPEQRALLAGALDFYKELAAAGGDDTDSRTKRAEAASRVAYVYAELGDPGSAAAALDEAATILEGLLAEAPDDPDRRLRLASVLNSRGCRLRNADRPADAAAAFERAVALIGPEPADPTRAGEHRKQLAMLTHNLGIVDYFLGRTEAAEARYRQVIGFCQPRLDDGTADHELLVHLGACRCNLGALLNNSGRPAEAVPHLDDAVGVLFRAMWREPRDRPTREFLGNSLSIRGATLYDLKRYAEAEASHRRALAVRTALRADFPAAADHRAKVGLSCLHLGRTLRAAGDPAAVPWFDQAVDHLEAVGRIDADLGRELADALKERGSVLGKLGRHPEAVADFERALELKHGSADDRHRLAYALTMQAAALAGPEQAATLERAQAEWQRLLDAKPDDPVYWDGMAGCRQALGRAVKGSAAAADHFRAAADYRRRIAAADPTVRNHSVLGFVLKDWSQALTAGRRPADAEPVLREAVALWSRVATETPTDPQPHVERAVCRQVLQTLMARLGREADALADSRAALAEAEQQRAALPNHDEAAVTLAAACCNLGHRLGSAESLPLYARAVELLGPLAARPDPPENAREFLYNSLGGQVTVNMRIGRFHAAEAARRRTLTLVPAERLPPVQLAWAECLVKCGRAAEAVAVCDEIGNLREWPAEGRYDLAAVYALASNVMVNRDECARRAVRQLRLAVAAGFDDADRLDADADFDPLRRRADYKRVRAGL